MNKSEIVEKTFKSPWLMVSEFVKIVVKSLHRKIIKTVHLIACSTCAHLAIKLGCSTWQFQLQLSDLVHVTVHLNISFSNALFCVNSRSSLINYSLHASRKKGQIPVANCCEDNQSATSTSKLCLRRWFFVNCLRCMRKRAKTIDNIQQ